MKESNGWIWWCLCDEHQEEIDTCIDNWDSNAMIAQWVAANKPRKPTKKKNGAASN